MLCLAVRGGFMSLNRIRTISWSPVLGLAVLLFAFGARASYAQMGQEGTVVVTVLDESAGAVEGARLELTDVTTNDVRTQVTQQLGSATFSRVPLGTYRLSVSKTSFRNEVIDTVVVQGGRVTEIKVSLKVGAAVETVVVDATAVPLIEATSNAIVTTLDVKQIEDLPLQGRDVSSLAQLKPGYSGTPTGGTWNGLPVIAQANTIDGVVSSTSRMKFGGNVQPGLEARLEDIQEMTVQTSEVDLSQGMGMASMQVNFVTRRGSNALHGRVYEDFRNTVLNANSWFNNAIGQPRNPIILNDFGGSAGGRIIKDKLFFFGSFAMSKQPGGYIAGINPLIQILSPLAQQGIFTYTQGPKKGQTVNLFTQVAQPNGQPVCGGSADPCAAFLAQQALITKDVGTPGSPAAGVSLSPTSDPNVFNVNWLVHSPTTKYYPAFRVDYDVSQKFRVDFSFEETKI